MDKFKFSTPVLAHNWVERQRLNQAADDLQALTRDTNTTEKQVLRLFELDRDQGHEIAKLQAVVYVLMQMLVESGAMDAQKLDERVRDAVTKLESNPEWQRMRGL
ncbi:hypothetical protein AKJ09_02803 [Labilithrix luteola]|uniref:Uncharacterized protein n=1 Tax=Labilithrix luteola TaxID=1391654 RepID=A0A0K1PSN6_9BACT|nr:hypothetical protein [Labilithrix luteola]AKU96139.1 hypothetical protein AKJ09_02803 [Labilithrix luteola]